MNNSEHSLLYVYKESGKPWPLYYAIGPLIVAILFSTGLVTNLSPIGIHDEIVAWIDSLAVIVSFILLWQIYVIPTLTVLFFVDKIVIVNKHGPIIIQRWSVAKLELRKIIFHSHGPFSDINFNGINYFPAIREYRKYLKYPSNIISLNNHKSAIEIISDTQTWLLGLSDSETVFNNIKRIYKESALYSIHHVNWNQAIIKFKKYRLKHYNPILKQLIIFPALVFAVTELVDQYILYKQIFIPIALQILIISAIVVSLYYYILEKYYINERIILEAFQDKIVFRNKLHRYNKIIVNSNEIKRITNIYVKDGNYKNIPDYIEGDRFAPWVGSHTAVTIETVKGKWAFDIPHPEEAAQALRKLYNME
ncbi:MAG: hypothetical protein NTY09_14065 [bacterium]|nr:hypothetical protein [bacterium]